MTKILLTTKEAATFLGVSAAFLERDRWAGARDTVKGAQIPFVRVGTRAVRYEREELERYIASKRRRSTSEPAHA